MSDVAKRYDDQRYLRLRRRAYRRAKRLEVDFTTAFNLVAQEEGFRDAQHAIHWLIPSEWWGPCDPPAGKGSAVLQLTTAISRMDEADSDLDQVISNIEESVK